MSFFDDASLVMIPSGYKTSKVYSVKPTDGSGDLAFTRSNDTATRVGPTGLIEKVRTNLSFYSEQFDNGFWNKLGTGLTVTANTTIAPNGTLTADTLNVSNNDNVLYGSRSTALAGNEFTFSIYVKGTGTFSMNIRLNSVTTTTETKTLTSDWQRFSVSVTNAVAVTSVEFYLNLNTSSTYNVWGAQVESGPAATDYIATTAAAVSVGPVANVPRLDYLNSSCPRLLLEPQRTNSAIYSEQFTNAAWTGGGATAVANQAVSPDGYTNADLIHPTISGNYIGKYQNIATATTGVVSCYVKQAGKRFAQLGTDNNATYTCAFDLQLGTVVRTATNYTATITSVGNGWFRITAAYVSSAAAVYPFVGVSDDADGVVTLDGTNGLYVYGFQYELSASYATSYIPTLGAAVTRSADAASKTGISALIGQQEGVLYWEGVLPQVSDGGPSNSSNMLNSARNINSNSGFSLQHINGSNSINALFFVGDGTFTPKVSLSAFSLPSGTYAKIAFAYKSGSSALYVNGVLVASSSTTFTSSTTISEIYLNDVNVYFGYPAAQADAQVLVFPTRLSNADLAALTA